MKKSDGYIARVYSFEYDLAAMLDAYGEEGVMMMISAIKSGAILIKDQRWICQQELLGNVPQLILDIQAKQYKRKGREEKKKRSRKKIVEYAAKVKPRKIYQAA